MATAQRGFTLIELVVVITILAILAAFAYPRFAALEAEARAATVNGFAGSLRAAATLAHSMDLATGNTGTVMMEASTINMVNGYPDLATIDDTVWDLSGFTYAPGTGLFTSNGATTPANCSIDYDEAAAVGTPPTFTIDTSGC